MVHKILIQFAPKVRIAIAASPHPENSVHHKEHDDDLRFRHMTRVKPEPCWITHGSAHDGKQPGREAPIAAIDRDTNSAMTIACAGHALRRPDSSHRYAWRSSQSHQYSVPSPTHRSKLTAIQLVDVAARQFPNGPPRKCHHGEDTFHHHFENHRDRQQHY
jgi:hypothetical protein